MHDNDDDLCPVCYLNACDCVVCVVCDAPVRVDPRTGVTGLCWRGHHWRAGGPLTLAIELTNAPPPLVRWADLAAYVEERVRGLMTPDDARRVFGLDADWGEPDDNGP